MANLINVHGEWVNTEKPGGQVFFVGGGTVAYKGVGASDINIGTDPQHPKATLASAHSAAQTSRGDTIVLLPGTITLTAAFAITKNDLTVCGASPVKPGEYPSALITAAATYDLNLITIDANNVTLDGLGFEAGFTTVTANQEVIQVNSANTAENYYGTVIENCYFDMGRAAGAASLTDTDLDVIRLGLDATDAAIAATVRGCTIVGYNQDAISITAGSINCVIENNRIVPEYTVGRTGVSILAIGALVRNNWIAADTSASTTGCVVVGVAAARAIVTDNHLVAEGGADTQGIHVIDTATVHSARNYIHAAAGNIVNFVTSSTTPSSSIDWGNVTNVNPAAPALVTATVDGT